MKNKLLTNKKGANSSIILEIFILFLVCFLVIYPLGQMFYYCSSVKDSSVTYINATDYSFLQVIPNSFLNKFTNYSNTFLNGSRGFLGFDSGFCEFVPDMIIGLIAGILMFIVYLCLIGIDYLKELSKGTDIFKRGKTVNPFERTKYGWLGLVAGALWKVLVFALFYSVLMQIPIVAGFVKLITLDFYLSNFLLKALFLACLVGYAPAFFEYFWKEMIKIKLQNKINKIEAKEAKEK